MGGRQSRSNGDVNDDGDGMCSGMSHYCGFGGSVGKGVQKMIRRVASGNNLVDGVGGRGNNDSDPMGSPLPSTPVLVRKRRKQVKECILQQGNDPPPRELYATTKESTIYSSKYAGLEKEVVGDSDDDYYDTNMNNGDSSHNGVGRISMANIHEGPDASKKLNATYELQDALGVGSTSTVHKCVHKGTGETRACKIIDVLAIEERFPGMMEQFEREIQALRELQHPSIIQLYDVYLTSEKIFIVMELMEGGELFDHVVQKGTLTEEEASQIVKQVCSAIVYMHSKNYVHRDLKPENLLLKEKPKQNSDEPVVVKIIDFGLCKVRT